jgi:hypothetical protein
VLCQLSYAPRLRPLIVVAPPWHNPGMSEHRPEEPAEDERDDDLQAEQEGKGYGEDEGEREQALDDEQS